MTVSSNKYHENPSSGGRVDTDGRTDMAVVGLCNIENTPINVSVPHFK